MSLCLFISYNKVYIKIILTIWLNSKYLMIDVCESKTSLEKKKELKTDKKILQARLVTREIID